ncbi:hypothetical protein GCM10027063_16900 [Promicromonospora xylanilytica]
MPERAGLRLAYVLARPGPAIGQVRSHCSGRRARAGRTGAHADPPPNLPQNATGIEQPFSPAFSPACPPAYDYDGDGWCAVMYASYFEKDQPMDGPIDDGSPRGWSG